MKNSVKNQDFKQILFKTKSLQIRDLLFYYRFYNKGGISFVVNSQKGNAVSRNAFKRRCRSLFQNKQKANRQNIQLIIKPVLKLKNNYSWKELTLSFEEFYSKLS